MVHPARRSFKPKKILGPFRQIVVSCFGPELPRFEPGSVLLWIRFRWKLQIIPVNGRGRAELDRAGNSVKKSLPLGAHLGNLHQPVDRFVRHLPVDDRGVCRPYSSIYSRMIETAHLNADEQISLSTLGRTYTIDFHSMQRVNGDTGTTRTVQRKINHALLAQPQGTMIITAGTPTSLSMAASI
ncbi:hypothetical protein quinque_013847 [Culex quinquefasciatus]